jgi:dephospho-CoA kinase
MKLIGLGGTNGSGKDLLGESLQELNNYLFVSVTDILRDEAKKRGQPIERSVLREISAEWRRESGLGVLIDKAVKMFKQTDNGKHDGLVIASLRNPGEADSVHELDGIVVWVDADPKVRYDRLTARQRSSEDNKTYEEFVAEEQAEMSHSGDEATLNSGGVKAKADIFIENNGNDLSEFKRQIEAELKDYLNR